MLITIDGPSGAGKSTVSRALAKILSYPYLETGALYRAIAYKITKDKAAVEDTSCLTRLLDSLNLKLEGEGSTTRVILDDIDISDLLRTEELGLLASSISALPIIREVLLPIQRNYGSLGSIIAEGRDMGSVVFPHADFKFFLTASLSERVRRRCKELQEAGLIPDPETVKKGMMLRDRQDSERAVAPLKVPADARVFDSTDLTVVEVVRAMRMALKD